MAAERGQASVELLGALPVLLLVGAVLLQLLALGYSATLAASAAEAGGRGRGGGPVGPPAGAGGLSPPRRRRRGDPGLVACRDARLDRWRARFGSVAAALAAVAG